MKKLMIALSVVLGLMLVATVAILLFLPDFPAFFAAEDGPQMAVLSPNLPPAPPQIRETLPAEQEREQEEYIPQTISEFLAQNPFPEGFVANNTALPWYLKLVNRYNHMEEDFTLELSDIGGRYFDARAANSLLSLINQAQEVGYGVVAISTHRGISRQRQLFDSQVTRNIDTGMSAQDAFEAARRVVAYPGTSEHNLGLAVDFVARGNYTLSQTFGQDGEGIWLAENAHHFGFILRYPDHKQHITNIIYEPWHFRYVGIQHATIMFENGIVLEEYIFWLQNK
ncbi:MAG: M15 family metallopeptidase [Defluviitaleaceae bacterium]|nr:M15 family metallopeptidase [Defluviitaleaceae bacterium]